MSTHLTRPENAYQKARDLVAVKKAYQALSVLHTSLSNRRVRTWAPVNEDIIILYIDLSSEHAYPIKEALRMYRALCSNNNVHSSLEKALRHYAKVARALVDKAEATAKAKGITLDQEAGEDDADELLAGADEEAAGDNDDDEAGGVREDFALKALASAEQMRERSDHRILTPWVRYALDMYRVILDLVRDNQRMERLYHEMMCEYFAFCERFKRISDFRRACDLMRSHTELSLKYKSYNPVDMSNPQTQELFLTTRCKQLMIASKLELWQEAYRTIEDIHEAQQRTGAAEPSTESRRLITDKLCDIFWAAKNLLFHAYSMYKAFHIALTSTEKLDAAERSRVLQELASATILAALAVPPAKVDEDVVANNRTDGHTRLALLLGFKKELPTRARLFALLSALGVDKFASPEVVRIYQAVEQQFAPLTMSAQIAPQISALEQNTSLVKYVEPLKETIVIRVLAQISTVFKTMKIERFLSLIPIPAAAAAARRADGKASLATVERLILRAVRSDIVAVRVDHASGLLHFLEDTLESQRSRDQLSSLARALSSIIERIQPVDATQKLRERQRVFGLIDRGVPVDEEAVRERVSAIEQRALDEQEESQLREAERIEQEAKDKAEREVAEARRRADEAVRAREEKAKREAEEKKRREAEQARATALKNVENVRAELAVDKKSEVFKKEQQVLKLLENDGGEIDSAKLLAAQQELLDSKRAELERRRRLSMRNHDFFVRATRVEERTLLVEQERKSKEARKEQLDAEFSAFVDTERKNFDRLMAERTRMVRMIPESEVFVARVMERRREQWTRLKRQQHQRFLEARQTYEAEQERRRVERERAEQERLRVEAELAARREEKERAERLREEERQRVLTEREEERQKARAAALLRQQREDELAERDRLARLERERESREGPFAARRTYGGAVAGAQAAAPTTVVASGGASSAGAGGANSAGGASDGVPSAEPVRRRLVLAPRSVPLPDAAPAPADGAAAAAAPAAAVAPSSEAPAGPAAGDRAEPPRRFDDHAEPRRYDDREQPRRYDDREQPRRYDDREQPRRYDDQRRYDDRGGDRAGPRGGQGFGGPRFGGGDRGDRPYGGDRGDRPAYGGGDRGDRPAYGGDRGDRPAYGGGDRGGGYQRGPRDANAPPAGLEPKRDWGDLRRRDNPPQQQQQ